MSGSRPESDAEQLSLASRIGTLVDPNQLVDRDQLAIN